MPVKFSENLVEYIPVHDYDWSAGTPEGSLGEEDFLGGQQEDSPTGEGDFQQAEEFDTEEVGEFDEAFNGEEGGVDFDGAAGGEEAAGVEDFFHSVHEFEYVIPYFLCEQITDTYCVPHLFPFSENLLNGRSGFPFYKISCCAVISPFVFRAIPSPFSLSPSLVTLLASPLLRTMTSSTHWTARRSIRKYLRR